MKVNNSMASVVTAYLLVASLDFPATSMAEGPVLAELTDASGTTFQLEEFRVLVKEKEGRLKMKGSLETFSSPRALPLALDDGSVAFVALPNVKGWSLKDGKATIGLLSGKSLSGAPLPECTFGGNGELGNFNVPATKVAKITFHQRELLEFLEKNSDTSWPARRPLIVQQGTGPQQRVQYFDASITLIDGNHVTINGPQLITEVSGSFVNTNWIPSKTEWYDHWELRESLPLLIGETQTDIEIARVSRIDLEVPEEESVKVSSLSVTMRSGGSRHRSKFKEKEKTSDDREQSLVATGLVGVTDFGYVYVPLPIIRSIELTPEKRKAKSNSPSRRKQPAKKKP